MMNNEKKEKFSQVRPAMSENGFSSKSISSKSLAGHGLKEGFSSGVYGEETSSKILTYDQKGLKHLLAPFLTPEITVCNSAFLWMQHILVGAKFIHDSDY